MGQVINRNVLHYRGDATDIDPHIIMGPDWLGSYYKPVSTVLIDGMTTMTLTPLTQEELNKHMFELMTAHKPKAEAAQRIRGLFQ